MVALWPLKLAAALRAGLAEGSFRKVEAFAATGPHAVVEWRTTPFDPFFNINTPEDLGTAETLLRREGGLRLPGR